MIKVANNLRKLAATYSIPSDPNAGIFADNLAEAEK